MGSPPPARREPLTPDRLTWRSVLLGCGLAAVIPLALWAISRPLAGAAALAATGGLVAAAAGTVRLGRCLHDCGGFALGLGGVRITVTRSGRQSRLSGCPDC